MARSKTGSFWLTDNVTLAATDPSGSRVSGTIDLGAYVDVGDQQALAIEQVDLIWQVDADFGGALSQMLLGSGALGAQLCDLNPGNAYVRADDHSLIASGALNIDVPNNLGTHVADFYPDNFGKLDESRMVVNDQLYVVAGNDASAIGAADVYLTVRIKCRIVKLGTKDWMAIAIQSTAADN